ncbi:MAG TPA: PspA/IM30 family protein [Candidatus Dormibacteraeota bacterium]|nr:PspA/IM30 family protein [Candidatus Dormibacteraeota bacterium]
MSVFQRMNDVIQQKVNSVLDKAEDPNQALDLSYQKQLEALQQVRRGVADVLTSEKRLELQRNELQQSQSKLQAQAREALQQGREDLARLALTRAQAAQEQLDGLQQQIAQLTAQEQKLEDTAAKLQAKVEAFRTQRETMKAQYTAAKASTQVGESVTGLSEHMADVNLMLDRAREKTSQMQARAAAVDQLMDSGALDTIGPGSQDDIDRQLKVHVVDDAVDQQLAAMKRQLGGGSAGQLSAGTIVVRIQGEDQYRLQQNDRAKLDQFDADLLAAIKAGDEPRFKGTLTTLLSWVRGAGQKLANDDLSTSDVVLPSSDMSLTEAQDLMAGEPAVSKS